VGAWVRGCVGAWVRGCVGAWVRGCVVAWLRGCVGFGAQYQCSAGTRMAGVQRGRRLGPWKVSCRGCIGLLAVGTAAWMGSVMLWATTHSETVDLTRSGIVELALNSSRGVVAVLSSHTSGDDRSLIEPSPLPVPVRSDRSDRSDRPLGAQSTGGPASSPKPPDTTRSQRNQSDVHVVFSTDCSAYQNWQSQVLFYSAEMVGHMGPITRIASGCSDGEMPSLRQVVRRWYWARVHFTPKFSKDEKTGREYAFYNKPRGILHWLAHGSPEAEVVALIDPDQFFLVPLDIRLASAPNLLVTNPVKRSALPDKVKQGFPAAQFYGLGDKWITFKRDYICGADSPCLKATKSEAWKYYSVGPPYILHIADWKRLARSWVNFVPKVYEEYPHLLAEMYAYCLAAAHEDLPHTRVDHFMVSNVGSYGEGWPHIDGLPFLACDKHAFSWQRSGSNGPGPSYFASMPTAVRLPTFLHACQSYKAQTYRFSKRAVPKSLFDSCESSFLRPIGPEHVIEPGVERHVYNLTHAQLKRRKTKEEHTVLRLRRDAFMTCTATRIVNEALRRHKARFCSKPSPS